MFLADKELKIRAVGNALGIYFSKAILTLMGWERDTRLSFRIEGKTLVLFNKGKLTVDDSAPPRSVTLFGKKKGKAR